MMTEEQLLKIKSFYITKEKRKEVLGIINDILMDCTTLIAGANVDNADNNKLHALINDIKEVKSLINKTKNNYINSIVSKGANYE